MTSNEKRLGRRNYERFDVFDEPYDSDNPYDDDFHRSQGEEYRPDTTTDPDQHMVCGMPHGPWSTEYARFTWGAPISNTGADPLGEWVTAHQWPEGFPDDFAARVIPHLGLEINRHTHPRKQAPR